MTTILSILTPLLDDFQRPDEAPLAHGWLVYPGYSDEMVLTNHVAHGSSSSFGLAYWHTLFGPDQEIWVTLVDFHLGQLNIAVRNNGQTVNKSEVVLILNPDGSAEASDDYSSIVVTDPGSLAPGDIVGFRVVDHDVFVLRSRGGVVTQLASGTTDIIRSGYIWITCADTEGIGPVYGGAVTIVNPQDTPWYDADRFTDPRDAPAAYFEEGAFDAQHGVKQAKVVDPLYQSNYDEGFAFGAELDTQLSRETM